MVALLPDVLSTRLIVAVWFTTSMLAVPPPPDPWFRSVSVLLPESVQLKLGAVASPNFKSPMSRPESRVMVRSAVMFTALKSAKSFWPVATVLDAQLVVVLQLPLALVPQAPGVARA